MTIAPKLRSTVLKMGLCSLLVIFVVPSLSSQEVEGNGNGTGGLFSPADYMEVSTPLTAKVGTNAYGFYLGNVQAGTYSCSPFMFDEIYHDFASGNWLRRNWVVAGVDLPANRHLTFQASYIRQDDQYLRSVNFLGLAVLIRTGNPSAANNDTTGPLD